MKNIRLACAAAASLFCAGAFAGPNDGAGPRDATAGSLLGNQGQVLCTAAINSDGTVAGGLNVNKPNTSLLSTGNYQVAFNPPCGPAITAAKGWARWVQVDTLTVGSIGGSCTTADRAGVANAVFVSCVDATGAPANLSYFLFVAR